MLIRDGKYRIRDGKKSYPGSGIDIPDPQHWFILYIHPSPVAEASLLFFIAFAQREKHPWDAEPRFELGPARQQASELPTGTLGKLLTCDGAVAEGRLEFGPSVILDFY
jgi:hypothetical protein